MANKKSNQNVGGFNPVNGVIDGTTDALRNKTWDNNKSTNSGSCPKDPTWK